MILANVGPSKSALLRAFAKGGTVQFNDAQPTVMTVEALCAVGCTDLPIGLPERRYTDAQSVWYVTGTQRGSQGVDYDPTIIALVMFDGNGRLTHAVLAIATEENQSADASTDLMINRAFETLLIGWLRGPSD